MHRLSLATALAVGAGLLPAQIASSTTYGTGCYSLARSYYENFATAASFDLGNSNPVTNLQHVFLGNAYLVLSAPAAWHTPTGTNLGLGDDTETNQALPFTFPYPGGTTTQLVICSNGFISPAASNGISYQPDPNALLAGFPRYCVFWHDLNPSAGGQVIFDSDPANGVVYVTWLNVQVYGAGGSNTFQAAFFATGNVELRYQSMSGQAITYPNVIVGWSPGGGGRDPGSRDISASVPFQTDTADAAPLALASSARPVLGTTINLLTTAIPPGTPAGALIFSFAHHDPGLSLASLGMPGCLQYVGLDVTVVFAGTGTTNTRPVAIPSNPIHAGSHVYVQTATFSPGFNALGVIASNGLDLKLDLQ
jgi:hypothetical protein